VGRCERSSPPACSSWHSSLTARTCRCSSPARAWLNSSIKSNERQCCRSKSPQPFALRYRTACRCPWTLGLLCIWPNMAHVSSGGPARQSEYGERCDWEMSSSMACHSLGVLHSARVRGSKSVGHACASALNANSRFCNERWEGWQRVIKSPNASRVNASVSSLNGKGAPVKCRHRDRGAVLSRCCNQVTLIAGMSTATINKRESGSAWASACKALIGPAPSCRSATQR